MLNAMIGGIGLFLLGMILMTDGLKAMAANSLRTILQRFVSGRFSAIASGAALTALVQSSSATTLATIGFVSAGLISFPQAVGVIFGVNLGTTSTGWIVSLLGFKLSVGAAALPLVGIGALLRLLGRGWLGSAGLALAGFGLIFVGIDTLQHGMAGLAEQVDPASFPGQGLPGRLLLVLVGAIMTVILQSSSAAVATTLAAFHSGAIGLELAAALVIGQNIGTTVKVILVSLGATVAVKRTALAHVLFNAITGLVALATLDGFVALATGISQWFDGDPGVIAIAAFHTLFNVVGVLIFLPWMDRFSHIVMRIIPDRGSHLTRRLDPSVAAVPAVGVEAARQTAIDVTHAAFKAVRALLAAPARPAGSLTELDRLDAALGELRRFLGRLSVTRESPHDYQSHIGTLHAIDHLARLIDAAREPEPPGSLPRDAVAGPIAATLAIGLLDAEQRLIQPPPAAHADQPTIAQTAASIADQRRQLRPATLELTAAGQIDPETALARLETVQWIDRLAYHAWRIIHHLHDPPPIGNGPNANAAPLPASAQPIPPA